MLCATSRQTRLFSPWSQTSGVFLQRSLQLRELIVLVDEDGEDWVGDAITDDASPVVAAPTAATGGSTAAQ